MMTEIEGLARRGTMSKAQEKGLKNWIAPSSVVFRQILFLDNFMQNKTKSSLEEDAVTDHMHMLKHIYRTAKYRKPTAGVKCFHNSETVKTLHNHLRFKCLPGVPCKTFRVDEKIGDLRHYRFSCGWEKIQGKCEPLTKHTVQDTYIWRYKDELKRRVKEALIGTGQMSN